ncbi:MAG: hypothetical protein COW42_13935 [Deltaproteobacteria bacterium CG17_big_fil_post_rev_8_21_14_2_50_63_7]|nr:MAG: hypothetical protein COW42_13935 [Deltaproteobacteria bacterium CG17_big_fil_post_rev_8_21_14_2_50_63_7]
MSDLLLGTASHDLELSADGDLQLVDEAEEVGQAAAITLDTQRGEWIYDLSFGVPWLEQILRKAPDLDTVRAVFVSTLLAVPGVNRIVKLELELDPTTRHLTATGEVDTVFGPVPFSL